MQISLRDFFGDLKILMDPRPAEKVFQLIKKALQEGKDIEISFKGIDIVIGTPLNVFIGKLYDPELELADKVDSIKFVDANESILEKIDMVKSNAIRYYEDKNGIRKRALEYGQDL